MSKDMGAPLADGLAGAEAPEPPSRLGPTDGIPSAFVLDEIVGHLGAAISQSIPSDDQRIVEHVRAAHELARILRRAA